MVSRRWFLVLVSVLALVAVVAGGLGSIFWAPEFRRGAHSAGPLLMTVEVVYPGASASTIRDTVAAPIEEQLNGVENMLSMLSQCSSDGRYRLQIAFKLGTDLNVAQPLVQQRIAFAGPVLPARLQQSGVIVQTVAPQPIALVTLSSHDQSHDAFFLGNFARRHVQAEFERLPAVGKVVLFGRCDRRLRINLNTQQRLPMDFGANRNRRRHPGRSRRIHCPGTSRG